MVDCPLGSDTHVKRKIEPSEGLTFWFADVPEDMFLSACVSSIFVFQVIRGPLSWLIVLRSFDSLFS